MGVLDAVELVLVLGLLPATLEVVNIDSCCISQSLWPGTSRPDLSPILLYPFPTTHLVSSPFLARRHRL